MPKLCEIIAIVSGRKTEAQKQLTDLHRVTSKAELFNGLNRVYKPRDAEDTETLPAETKTIQVRSQDAFNGLEKTMSNVYDLILTQDTGNTKARADVVVDGFLILKDVPVTSLLYFEKQLEDLKKFYASIPVLDPSVNWHKDSTTGVYKTTSTTHRAKRKKVAFKMADATDKHPAQVQIIEEESVVGDWLKTDTSAALSLADKTALMDRIVALKEAVVLAREKANSTDVENRKAGEALFSYLHKGLTG